MSDPPLTLFMAVPTIYGTLPSLAPNGFSKAYRSVQRTSSWATTKGNRMFEGYEANGATANYSDFLYL